MDYGERGRRDTPYTYRERLLTFPLLLFLLLPPPSPASPASPSQPRAAAPERGRRRIHPAPPLLSSGEIPAPTWSRPILLLPEAALPSLPMAASSTLHLKPRSPPRGPSPKRLPLPRLLWLASPPQNRYPSPVRISPPPGGLGWAGREKEKEGGAPRPATMVPSLPLMLADGEG